MLTKEDVIKIKCKLAQKNLYEYAKLIKPHIFNDFTPHLKEWCEKAQNYLENGKMNDFFNLAAPPRMGKSMLFQTAIAWWLGNHPTSKFAVLCYDEDTAVKYGEAVRDVITATKPKNSKRIIHSDIFPGSGIQKGKNSKTIWRVIGATEDSFIVFTPRSGVTGFGINYLIIDDIIKDSSEARNEAYLEGLWDWMQGTVFSRLEYPKKVISTSTRWASKDIAGMIEKTKKDRLESHIYKVVNDSGDILCPFFLGDKIVNDMGDVIAVGDGKQMLQYIIDDVSPDMYSANYLQIPVDVKGKLYDKFKTFNAKDLPEKDEKGRKYNFKTQCIVDTANRGKDYLCAIFFINFKGYIYIKDVYYTQSQMTITEDELVKLCKKNKCSVLIGEGNNGGEIFIRNIKTKYEKLYGKTCTFGFFIQKSNKETRILNQAAWVQSNILMPENWGKLFPDFYRDIEKFQKNLKDNKHDDCADCLTMIADAFSVEKSGKKGMKIHY